MGAHSAGNTGGVVILPRRAAFPQDAEVTRWEPAPGRVLGVRLHSSECDGDWTVWSIHNSDMAPHELRQVEAELAASWAHAAARPLSSLALAAGDLIFAPNETAFRVPSGEAVERAMSELEGARE